MTPIRLTESFYHRDCLVVAPELVGSCWCVGCRTARAAMGAHR
ncbi:MAG: hypothetical protein ACLT3Y_06195 [Ruminococcus callidus]